MTDPATAAANCTTCTAYLDAAANCTTCTAYLDARLGALMEHLVTKAAREATALIDALADYMGKVHIRHTSGLAIDIPGYTWSVHTTPSRGIGWVLRRTEVVTP